MELEKMNKTKTTLQNFLCKFSFNLPNLCLTDYLKFEYSILTTETSMFKLNIGAGISQK